MKQHCRILAACVLAGKEFLSDFEAPLHKLMTHHRGITRYSQESRCQLGIPKRQCWGRTTYPGDHQEKVASMRAVPRQ